MQWFMVHPKIIYPHPIFWMLIKSIIVFIPIMNGIMAINIIVITIIFNSSWFDAGRCMNNTLFLWYITADSRYFTRFKCLFITPRTIICTNTKKVLCKSTCCKTKNLGSRKWILLMPKMKIIITGVFSFPDKLIAIKGTILLIEVSIFSPKYYRLIWNSSADNHSNNAFITLLNCFLLSLS